MAGLDWLWWGMATWLAVDLAAAAFWAWHRGREKRREEITQALRKIGVQRAREAALERDLDRAYATRQRLIDAALTRIPHQTRRTEEP